MSLPDSKALAKYALPSVEDKEIVRSQTLTFQGMETIDDKGFDHHRIDRCALLGTAEEWVLRAESEAHPFHIHVNPFEVRYSDGRREWRDTIMVTKKNSPIVVRMRFQDFSGKTVLHCHNLDHEDRGMMQTVEIVDPTKAPAKTGFAKLPWPAPDWSCATRSNCPTSTPIFPESASSWCFSWGCLARIAWSSLKLSRKKNRP
jgi:hypothetical protein